jgi:hypothetical protein
VRAWTRHVGYQDDGTGGALEMRNCTVCGSTLYFEVSG